MDIKLRIWHIANPPRGAFRVDVSSVQEAAKILTALADYDLFLGDGSPNTWTTVGSRRNKRIYLAREVDGDTEQPADVMRLLDRATALRTLDKYDAYLLEHCRGGVPYVVMNAQGLESFEGCEWCEFYDDDGNDIDDLMRQAADEKAVA